MLVKGGVYLEKLGDIKTVAFDKTGTLTKGVPVVTDFEVLNDQVEEKELFSTITALEYRSQHPLASAIMKRQSKIISLILMYKWKNSLRLLGEV